MTSRPFAGSLPGDRTDEKMDSKPYDFDNGNAVVAAGLRKILQMTAETPEEKFKVLDTRDKFLKIIRDKDPSVKRGALVATCPDMCPEKERLLRDYQGRGSVFEMTNFSKNSNFNHNLAVKEYARSSADQEEPLPHDLRPVHVLTMTMSHLLHNVADFCELTDDNLEDWYLFMWDRTRAIRKELTQQGVCSLESVTLVEQCARFHIHSAERLVDQDTSVYDDKINTENLTKCLQTLKYMYRDLAKEDIKCPNEPEFICYTLLLNLNNSSVFTELSNLSESVMTSVPVKFALDLMTAWETRNYIQFFNLVKKTTYLNCCLLRRYFGEMRLYAIKTMIRSYCTKTYSPQIVITRFVENLNFEGEEECLTFLSQCNFNFHQVNGKTVVNFDRVLFQNPTSTLTSGRAYLFIEEKKQRPLSVVMAGGTLPPKLYENHSLQNSFTEDGVLKPDSLPKTDLFDFTSTSSAVKSPSSDSKSDSNKSRGTTGDVFQKDSQIESGQDQGTFKKSEESTTFSQTPLLAFKDPKPPTSNIFGSVQPSSFNKISETPNIFSRNFQNKPLGENIFDSSKANMPEKSIFGNQSSSFSFNNKPNVISSESKTFPTFTFTAPTNIQTGTEQNTFAPSLFKVPSSASAPSNQLKSVNENVEWKEEQKRLHQERLEQEKLQKEKEELERRKKKEEERLKMILEEKRLQEENERRKREEQERERKRKEEERARLEREEKRRREEQERQEKQRQANAKRLAELKRLEDENKRKIELAYQQTVEKKMKELKEKLQKWKTKIVFEKWRMNTWSKIEERKMKDYFKEVKIKYPPVCTEEFIDGNPYGLLIPSILTFEKFKNWRQEFRRTAPKKLLIVNEELPLLKVDSLLGKPLEDRAKSLGFKAESEPFPWLLLISIPDESESPEYWKSIETFVEMHFVESYNWQFGVQEGPLYCRSSGHGSFRFKISIRKVRGSKLFEGSKPNPSATTGINALVFFVTDNGNKVTGERLKAILKHKALQPKIPIIIISLNGQSEQKILENVLELEKVKKTHISDYRVLSVSEGKQQLVAQLVKSLNLASTLSASPSSLRVCPISTFFTRFWLEIVWRRIEISLSNFKVSLHEPKILIEFYNSCLDKLSEIFFDKSYDNQTILSEEFLEFDVKRPERTTNYKEKIMSLINCLKLPHWPEEIPKSSHQLNYRIHQYCKKAAGEDKLRVKNLKWILYRIIRQSLLWKGLDIYCDEDIQQIIVNFPWLQVFQEISKVLILQLNEKFEKNKEPTVIYDVHKLNNFSFEPSLISKFLKKSKRQKKLPQSFGEEEEIDDLAPCLEKDSVVYAYSAAIERETNKRKREECIEESIDALFSSPAEKRIDLDEEEIKDFNITQLECSFQSISDRLDRLKNVMSENSKILMDIQNGTL